MENVNDEKWKFEVPDYDILVDSPIQIGDHKVFHFNADGVDYQVAMVGRGNYDIDTLLTDLKKIVETETKVFGENPNKNYIFIVHNTDIPSGGLEHLNSTSLQVNRFIYKPDITRFLGLAAHEHFHLWNVKRLRPITLGPFNYNKPNYTTLLWVCEGITDYYSALILRRTGLISSSEFLKRLSNVINEVKNQPGDSVQSVAMASFDAWIKAYQPDENSANSTISYYGKGMILGALLDLEIIKNTNGKKCLDDVMRYMYDKYYKKLKRGYTKEEWKAGVEKIAGENLDNFFKNYVYGTKPINYEKYFNYAGIQILETPKSTNPYLGISVSEKDGILKINTVYANTSAYNYGLNANDEIIAINDFRTNMDIFEKLISTSNIGDTLNFTISRNGVINNIKVVLGKDEQTDLNLFPKTNMSNEEKLVYNKWLRENLKLL
jgi:predicted metalloprotease with PDZ domain